MTSLAQARILAEMSDEDKGLVMGLQAGQQVNIRLHGEILRQQRQFIDLTDEFKIALGTNNNNNIQLSWRTIEGPPGVGDFTMCVFKL